MATWAYDEMFIFEASYASISMTPSEYTEVYDLLQQIHGKSGLDIEQAYRLMRDALDRLCRVETQAVRLQATDLSARIGYVATKHHLPLSEENALHALRLRANDLMFHRRVPRTDECHRDIGTLARLVQTLSGLPLPTSLQAWATQAPISLAHPLPKERQHCLRVSFREVDERFLYVQAVDNPGNEWLRLHRPTARADEDFIHTYSLPWPHATLHLIDVDTLPDGSLKADMVVLEPDYLVDISALAACHREFGSHSGNYAVARLQPGSNTRALLLGNIVNLFLDEWIQATDNEPDYRACMQKAFKQYPVELASCPDLQTPRQEHDFFADCLRHFEHLRQVVKQTFLDPGYRLNTTEAVLEPTFLCAELGLQGRLDYMQQDLSALIEMKSGKADEWLLRGRIVPKEDHRIQMLLYQAVLQRRQTEPEHEVHPYLLYTRYPLLYPARASRSLLRRAIDLRNRIVATEHSVQGHETAEETIRFLNRLTPDALNERGLSGTLWENYLHPSLNKFARLMDSASEVERCYVGSLYAFITRELYCSKVGGSLHEGNRSTAALWQAATAEKLENGDMLCNLRIVLHQAHDALHPRLKLAATEGDISLSNFRPGDVVLLYERTSDHHRATNRMVFKASVEAIGQRFIDLRLRAAQRNTSVLPADSLYAIEPDSMDTGFRAMYQGLTAFLSTSSARRELLLGLRAPRIGTENSATEGFDDIERIARKATSAPDYFLLVGPPGTGKTSRALKRMVELLLEQPQNRLLLLAYTNRAVDEICKSISSIAPTVDFLRVGNEQACAPEYRHRLLPQLLEGCQRRSQVLEILNRTRVVVGTVASLSGRPELLAQKGFDVAIVDEASQILEPQLLPILCASTRSGAEAVGRFILIGDHKQLPAVVVQTPLQSRVNEASLRSLNITDWAESLFERLYRLASKRNDKHTTDLLHRQGRMHPAVASFVNQAFYEGKLRSVGLPHQQEPAEQQPRLVFCPSTAEPHASNLKTNQSEARWVARLAQEVYARHGFDFDPATDLGIITPYRSQIACIKHELEQTGIPALAAVTVDTVERYQGSERNVIIYSCCVNRPYQLRMLSQVKMIDGRPVDRKLNVALTRARHGLFVVGAPELLKLSPLYADLIEACTPYQAPTNTQ